MAKRCGPILTWLLLHVRRRDNTHSRGRIQSSCERSGSDLRRSGTNNRVVHAGTWHRLGRYVTHSHSVREETCLSHLLHNVCWYQHMVRVCAELRPLSHGTSLSGHCCQPCRMPAFSHDCRNLLPPRASVPRWHLHASALRWEEPDTIGQCCRHPSIELEMGVLDCCYAGRIRWDYLVLVCSRDILGQDATTSGFD